MRAVLPIVLALVTCGCSLDETGIAPRDGGVIDVHSIDVSSETASSEAAADAPADVVADGTCDPDLCMGERCTNDACDYYPSCAAMHTADTTRTTGVHHFRGSNGPFDAWCDMDTDQGGWTLVARSVWLQSSNNFGWFNSSSTDPTDRNTPYSLDAPAEGVTFTKALVGEVDDNAPNPNTWGGNVNRVALPSGFPGNFISSSGGAAVTIIATTSSCFASQVTMLTNVGYTGHASQFYFRDNPSDGAFGLFPDGFSLNYGDCRSATMDGNQGMVMVR